MTRRPPTPTLFPYNDALPISASRDAEHDIFSALERWVEQGVAPAHLIGTGRAADDPSKPLSRPLCPYPQVAQRLEEHTSELQSLRHLVCRLLLEKKKKNE